MDNQTKDLLMLTVDKVPELPQDDREKLLWVMKRLTATPSSPHSRAGELLTQIPGKQMNHVMGYLEGVAAGSTRPRQAECPPMSDDEKGSILKMFAELPEALKERAIGFVDGLVAATAAGRSASQPEQAEKEKEEAPANA